jgi:hypothetical protein
VQLHNRYWSPLNIYATQNGGKYNFHVEAEYAIPDDSQFWVDLMAAKRKSGTCLLLDRATTSSQLFSVLF